MKACLQLKMSYVLRGVAIKNSFQGASKRRVFSKNDVCRGPRYIEVDIDVGSSSAAYHVTGLVQGSLKSLVIDLAVVLEGRSRVNLANMIYRQGYFHSIILGYSLR